MIKCFSVEDVKTAMAEVDKEMVNDGYFNADDSAMFLAGFNTAIDKFYKEHNVGRLFMFEEKEIEDEEFGMVEIDGEWKMMYMSSQFVFVRFTLE